MANHMDHKGNKSRKLKYVLGGLSEARKCSTSWLSCQSVKRPCLTHGEPCPVAGSQETSGEVVDVREHMCIGQTPDSSLRQRNNILVSWGLENQAETSNNSIPANWNGHIFPGL